MSDENVNQNPGEDQSSGAAGTDNQSYPAAQPDPAAIPDHTSSVLAEFSVTIVQLSTKIDQLIAKLKQHGIHFDPEEQ